MASDKQYQLPLIGGEPQTGFHWEDAPVNNVSLMERVLDRNNLILALQKVKRNKGGAGIDGMTVDDLPAFLTQH